MRRSTRSPTAQPRVTTKAALKATTMGPRTATETMGPTGSPWDYDTIIVGAGPVGMTLATYLPGRILLIEQNGDVGGCHYVDRGMNNLFSEHGPRVYSGAYINMRSVLETIGLRWSDLFVPTSWSPAVIDNATWFKHMTLGESMHLSLAFCAFCVNPGKYKKLSVDAWASSKRFSATARWYMDQVCRFSDGAASNRYSMYEFLSGFNEHTLYGFYEPRRAHDTVLWPHWKGHLATRGVSFMLNTCVKTLESSGTRLVTHTGRRISAPRIIFAVPPMPLATILKQSKLTEPGFDAFARKTKYNEYWSLACHFDQKPHLEGGTRSTPWGLIYIDMPFESEPMHVVSVAATRFDSPSPVTGKTLKQTTDETEAANEIVRQLMEVIGGRQPVHLSYPQPKFGDHAAFVASAGSGFFGPTLSCCHAPVYTVGTHNGMSNYHFTSFESAVQNALVFAEVPLQAAAWKLTDLVTLCVAALVLLVAWRVLAKHTKRG